MKDIVEALPDRVYKVPSGFSATRKSRRSERKSTHTQNNPHGTSRRRIKICHRTIEYSFYLLFFLVPLVMTPWNHELFEFNKMMLVYLLTTLIVAAWLIKMVLQRRIIFHRTLMDIPFLLFLTSQFASTLLSIDRHTSFWGYYSRFHGGLASTICYLLLYWAFVSNFAKVTILNISEAPMRVAQSRRGGRLNESEAMTPPRWKRNNNKMVKNCLAALLGSATLVSVYGIAEHFGIDARFWIQDVQNRVFSTLGQPNWLATWLAAIIPLTWSFTLIQLYGIYGKKKKKKADRVGQKSKLQSKVQKFLNFKSPFYILNFTFYICLLYTKSRSGLLGFGVSYLVFWPLVFWLNRHRLKNILKPFLIFTFSILLFTFSVGSPWTPSAKEMLSPSSTTLPAVSQADPQLITHNPPQLLISESSDIRKVVWQGAINIWKHHPWLGTGTETFAYSYYWYRPRKHNDLSEWDFLYNKAHNEYLNFAATSGIIGLGSYLLVIGSFLFWALTKIPNFKFLISKQIPSPKSQILKKLGQLEIRSIRNLEIALLAGYISILVTNFFGFSVVPVALLFFLYPALAVTLTQGVKGKPPSRWTRYDTLGIWQYLSIGSILLFTFYILHFTFKSWYADFLFARGEKFNNASQYEQALESLQKAIVFRPKEPFYHNEIASALANLAVLAYEEENSTPSAQLAERAIAESDQALAISPYHLNFWKNRTQVFYKLAEIDENYCQGALASLLRASELAPTDAKISYNLALLYARVGQDQTAIKTLEETIRLKPNYADARYALALFYEKEGKIKEAKQQLEYILEKINSQHEAAREKLESL